ncbi:MAG: hypothetical protein RIQ74_1148 [Pseudomonadota bacterium]|jgi:hypothetical protein
MSELISGKDVVIAILGGKDLLWKKPEWRHDEKEDVNKSMWNIEELLTGKTVAGDIVEFYLKPRTITINGIEVPAPFEPKDGDEFWILFESHYSPCGYKLVFPDNQYSELCYGAWRTESEIRQVVAALRSIFK